MMMMGGGGCHLVEEGGYCPPEQRSNPVNPVVGEVAKDSSWTEAVGWIISRLVNWLIGYQGDKNHINYLPASRVHT